MFPFLFKNFFFACFGPKLYLFLQLRFKVGKQKTGVSKRSKQNEKKISNKLKKKQIKKQIKKKKKKKPKNPKRKRDSAPVPRKKRKLQN